LIVDIKIIELHLGACPGEERKERTTEEEEQGNNCDSIMTTTEALRLQLDNLQKEKQELEVRNSKLSNNPSKEVLRGKGTIGKKNVRENGQLKLLYEELFQQFSGGQTNLNGSSTGLQNIAELQEMEKGLRCATHWKARSELLEKEIDRLQKFNNELGVLTENNLELECFRAEARVRGQWETREGRLVEHLAELQCQLRGKQTEESLPKLKMDELVT